MRIAYFDCFCGAAGDMILGALISAGLAPDDLRADLAGLRLDGYEMEIGEVRKQGFAATRLDVRLTADPPHRHLHHITAIIEAADLPQRVKDRACRVFARLAEAEAKVHGTTIEKVHFHEVGAVDAIVDIVGAVAGIDRLGIERIVCSPIPTGSGTVQCDHGVMPVPAPATAEILVGVPLAACDEPGELTTPTGAAILTTLADEFGALPAMRMECTGYGAGSRDGKTRPNVLRVILGESSGDGELEDQVVLLETNLDDATGEQIGHASERLFAAGAFDVFTTPITMKKNRPGVLLSVLAPLDKHGECERVLFAETTTFGIRWQVQSRCKLRRRIETVTTAFGDIRVKLGLRDGDVIRVAPEYDDCSTAAAKHGVSLDVVMDVARRAWRGQ